MPADDIRQDIELKVVELIKAKLADGTMTDERSQEISQAVLDILTPGMTLEALYRAIPKLDDRFPELSAIVHPIVKEYEERVVQPAQKNVSELIRQGQFDAAAKLAQDAIKQDVKLAWVGSSKIPG